MPVLVGASCGARQASRASWFSERVSGRRISGLSFVEEYDAQPDTKW